MKKSQFPRKRDITLCTSSRGSCKWRVAEVCKWEQELLYSCKWGKHNHCGKAFCGKKGSGSSRQTTKRKCGWKEVKAAVFVNECGRKHKWQRICEWEINGRGFVNEGKNKQQRVCKWGRLGEAQVAEELWMRGRKNGRGLVNERKNNCRWVVCCRGKEWTIVNALDVGGIYWSVSLSTYKCLLMSMPECGVVLRVLWSLHEEIHHSVPLCSAL